MTAGMGGAMSDEVRVDPSVLNAGATVCRDVRAGIGSRVSDVEPETVAAQDGLPGWSTARALKDLTWWWRDDLDRLGKRLGSTADALDACATDYTTTDRANADHFYHAERSW